NALSKRRAPGTSPASGSLRRSLTVAPTPRPRAWQRRTILPGKLVAAGVPDAPMHVYTAGLKGCLVWRSFHKAACYTVEETATKPEHMVRWESPEARAARITATLARKHGVKAPARTPVAPERSAA